MKPRIPERMTQFGADGRFIRSHKFNKALRTIWMRQCPHGRIEYTWKPIPPPYKDIKNGRGGR
jgi:hypothetical protein